MSFNLRFLNASFEKMMLAAALLALTVFTALLASKFDAAMSRLRRHFMLRLMLLVLLTALLAPTRAMAQTQIYTNQNWIVVGTTDTAGDASDIMVSLDGAIIGMFSELAISYGTNSIGFAQMYQLKGSGGINAVPWASGAVGGTFYTSGYWDCDAGLVQKMRFLEIDIRGAGNHKKFLEFSGRASNLNSFETKNCKLRFFAPTIASNGLGYESRVDVDYRLVATRDFCVDLSLQDSGQTFRTAWIASNYFSPELYLNDQVNYFFINGRGSRGKTLGLACINLTNDVALLVSNPGPLVTQSLFLAHTSDSPGNSPTLLISFTKPRLDNIRPQGRSIFSTDPFSDNVEVWGNWSDVKGSYSAGQAVGRFRYSLVAMPPGPVTFISCDTNSVATASLAAKRSTR